MIDRMHYGADLDAFASTVRLFATLGRSDKKPTADADKIRDLIAIRDKAEKLLEKWGELSDPA